ncbi:toll-like receptor 2 [Lepeophtheirus salmonis]|uniref:toll-like receptor 2 n=1 Tax=Lepeophtheirus salmonis TaxID=72036 RepID=UPI003AF3443D
MKQTRRFDSSFFSFTCQDLCTEKIMPSSVNFYIVSTLLYIKSINCQYHYTDNFVDHENSSMDKFSADIAPLNIRGPNSTCDVAYLLKIPVCFTRELIQPPSMSYIPPKNCRYFENNEKIMFCENEISNPFTWTHSELHFLQLENHFTLKKLPNISNIHTRYLRIYAETLELINGGENSDRIIGLEIYGGKFSHGTGNLNSFIFWDSFIGFPHLVRLILSNNCISLAYVQPSIKQPILLQLEYLSLMDNRNLGALHNKIFYPLRYSPLVELNLRNCHIKIIGTKVFKYLKGLNHLDLRGNKELFTLGAKYPFWITLHPFIKNIKILGLSDLGLLLVPQYILYQLQTSRVEVLNLSNNIYFHFGYFLNKSVKLPHLRVMIIDNSEVISIRNYTFLHLGSSLKAISLRKNHLNKLWPGFLLPTLEFLDLSYQREVSGQNPKFVIEPNIFKENPMTKLKVLRLRGLKTDIIHRYTFEGLYNLEELDLSDSIVQTIEEGSFIELKSLKKLHLSNCKNLKDLNGGHVAAMQHLRYLDISHTNLFNGIPNDFSSMNLKCCSRLEFINLTNTFNDFQDNSIDDQMYVRMWSYFPNLKTLDLSHNRLIPWEKPIFLQNKKLHTLFLRQCAITHISTSMLKDFSKLSFLDMSDNLRLTCGFDVIHFHNLTLHRSGLNVFEYENGSGIFCHFPRNHTIRYVSFKNLFENFKDFFPPHIEGNATTITWLNKLLFTLLIISLSSLTIGIRYVYSNRYYISYHWMTSKMNYDENKNNNRSYTYDAFISYSDKDREWVFSELIPHLEEDFNVCVHERDFKVGMMVVDNIVSCIDKSRKFIAVLSPSFVNSRWCAFEIHVAQNQMKKSQEQFLVIIKDKVPKKINDKGLNYILKTWTYITWPNVYCKTERLIFWNRLRKGIF